jgi:hypothetical protein
MSSLLYASCTSHHSCLNLACTLQGTNRLQRALLYLDYLRHWSNGAHRPRVTKVPNMGHSAPLLFTSPTFLSFVGLG